MGEKGRVLDGGCGWLWLLPVNPPSCFVPISQDGFDYPSTDEDETPEEELERLRHWSGASVRQQKELTVPDHTKIEYLRKKSLGQGCIRAVLHTIAVA